MKLAANVVVRLAVLALILYTWRPWEDLSSPITWILGALMVFLLAWTVRMILLDGRALLGLLGEQRRDGAPIGDRDDGA